MLVWILLIIFIIKTTAIDSPSGCDSMQKTLNECNSLMKTYFQSDQMLRDELFISYPMPGWSFYVEDIFSDTDNELMRNASALVVSEQFYNQKYLTSLINPYLKNDIKMNRLKDVTICVPKNQRCKVMPICDPQAKYRTIDGTCNNLENPNIGSAFSQFTRLLPADYLDGIHEVRKNSKTNEPMVSPRVVSNLLFTKAAYTIKPPILLNINGVIFAQMLAHDISNTVNTGSGHGHGSHKCCSSDLAYPLEAHLSVSECKPTIVPPDDPYYSQHNIGCLEYVRAQTAFNNDCQLGQSQKISVVSSYLDISPVYGRNRAVSNSVRTLRGGQLKLSANGMLFKQNNCTGYQCYLFADIRQVNNPTLIMQTIVFARLHNKIASLLSDVQMWNDQQLFEEARRITIAIYQHIVIDEFLPIIFDNDYFSSKHPYNSNVNGAALSEFSTAALRYFHTLAPNWFAFYSNATTLYARYAFSDVLVRPEIVEPNFLGVIRGSLYESARFDNFPDQLRNHAFKGYNGIGIDMVSVDINRSRDYGVQPYYRYIELCQPNATKIVSWDDLTMNISPENIAELKKVYDSVFDVDLNAGIYMERKDNQYIGAVGKCILFEQFHRLIHGDRFFYNNSLNSFNEKQLQTIGDISFARILCEVSGVEEVPLKALQMPSENNPIVKCKNMPTFSIEQLL